MDKKEICKKIKKATKKIILLSNGKVVNTGTGVIIKNDGILLTANHVVNNFKKIPNPRIFVIFTDETRGIVHMEYEIMLSDVTHDSNLQFIKPVEIDLAILRPKQKIDLGDNYIELEKLEIEEGEDVIMAGFPDEIKLAFDFYSLLDFNNPELAQKRTEIENMLNLSMSLMMIKSGMIGAIHKINLNGKFCSKDVSIRGCSYWIDNASTYGASGGALVNSNGKLIGIICQKGETALLSIPNIKIPSGSTMALSHKLITWALYL